MSSDSICQRYADTVANMDIAAYRAGQSPSTLLISKLDNLTVEYAPFDHIERKAELVIVGLTPGRTQASNALESLSVSLRKGLPLIEALAIAKRTASFSGPMRANLLAMLNAIGVPALFERRDASEFFVADCELVHFTSTLRYPVYVDGENYSGNPRPLVHRLLRPMIDTYLAEEASALPQAVWIPLGNHAEEALLHLAQVGRLDRRRVLSGLPHPSGANAERIAYFLDRKSKGQLSPKTNAGRLDQLKFQLLDQVASLRR